MTDLETALTKYTEAKKLAELNLEDVPMSVRPGRESQKRQAQAEVPNLESDYGRLLQKAAFGIAVDGEGTDEFVKIASEEADCLVIDGSEMYKRIADRIAPAMSNDRRFGVSNYSVMIQELRVIGGELELTSLPSPAWTEAANVGDEAGLLNHVRGMVESSAAGLDLLALYMKRQLACAGLKAGATKNTVPVLVTGVPPTSAASVLAKVFTEGRSLHVPTTKEVNKKSVLDTFNTVKKQIKSNSTTTTTVTREKLV